MTDVERIEIGSIRMRHAWQQGIENYVPTASGHDMKEEAGITDHSLSNLRHLHGLLGLVATEVRVGPNSGILFCFGLETYLATGFGVGYPGTGSVRLAELGAELGFGDFEVLRARVLGLSQDFQGLLWTK